MSPSSVEIEVYKGTVARQGVGRTGPPGGLRLGFELSSKLT